ncbi:MAG: hypothetical protein K2N39_01470 [Lachnospiraceae bacterium]|nr:hypothetical protein [Lachnospiraceae bacterium]
MKKALVLALVGAMVFSMPVMAKETGAPEAVYLEDSSYIGINAETVRAIDENKTIQEHNNNAVTDHWDMEGDAIQNLAIGQGAVLDGEAAPGLTFNLMKPELKRVYAAKALAQGKGSLLAVANVHTHAAYETAAITFYAPGVKAGDAITVYQRVTDDEWTAVPTVVTDDHVAVEITDNTHLAFIKAPVVVAAPVAPKAATPVEKPAQEDSKADVETLTVVEKNDAEKTEVKADEKAADAKTDKKAADEESDAETDENVDDEESDAETDEKADAAN